MRASEEVKAFLDFIREAEPRYMLALEAMKSIPVRMVSYGGSNYNISFLIREEDKKRALQSLSDTLFNK